jgi:hypothetical protein
MGEAFRIVITVVSHLQSLVVSVLIACMKGKGGRDTSFKSRHPPRVDKQTARRRRAVCLTADRSRSDMTGGGFHVLSIAHLGHRSGGRQQRSPALESRYACTHASVLSEIKGRHREGRPAPVLYGRLIMAGSLGEVVERSLRRDPIRASPVASSRDRRRLPSLSRYCPPAPSRHARWR